LFAPSTVNSGPAAEMRTFNRGADIPRWISSVTGLSHQNRVKTSKVEGVVL
jgi:hypothetical protein